MTASANTRATLAELYDELQEQRRSQLAEDILVVETQLLYAKEALQKLVRDQTMLHTRIEGIFADLDILNRRMEKLTT